MLLVVGAASTTSAALPDGAIIVPEIFEELYQIAPGGGSASDLLNSPLTQEVVGQHLAVVDSNTAYLTSFSDLYKFNFSTGQLSFVDQLSFVPRELTVDHNGQLIAVAPGEVFRVSPVTGAESSLHSETFFNPSDAVVDSTGNVYLTEFFDGLGVLSSGGNFSKIGNYSVDQFAHLDLGPDGFLYLSTTFGASFYRVNPATGVGVQLDSNVFTFIDDLQVDASGDILFAGEVGFKSGVFRFNPTTKLLTTVVDDTTVNGGFFDPQDIAVFSSTQAFASADFDTNGSVDSADLAQWVAAHGVTSAGDTDSDGDTDGADFLAWQNQYDGSSTVSATIVPESATLVMLMLGLAHTVICWRTTVPR